MTFPMLKTSTLQIENGEHVVVVRKDPVYEELKKQLQNKEDTDRFFRFAHCTNKQTVSTCSLSVTNDKTSRTQIHRLLAKQFGSFLESKTFPCDPSSPESPCIQVRMRAKLSRSKERKTAGDNKTFSKITGPRYTHFTLQKTGLETLEAIERLSRVLRAPSSAFSYAGIKDRKAVTIQRVAVKGFTSKQLVSALDRQVIGGIVTGGYKTCDAPLRLGQLCGNFFQINVRGVQPLASSSQGITELVTTAVSNVSRHGFVNYFGPQRFGQEDNSVNASDVGLAMLQGDVERAVRLILSPSNSSVAAAAQAKRYYKETGDIPGTLARMPPGQTRERLILKALHRHGRDKYGCTQALLSLPYSARLLYAHSYTSLAWNHAASARVRLYGSTRVAAGDLVYDSQSASSQCGIAQSASSQCGFAQSASSQCVFAQSDSSASSQCGIAQNHSIKGNQASTESHRGLVPQTESNGSHSTSITRDSGSSECDCGKSAVASSNPHRRTPIDKCAVRVVSEDDARSGKYSMADVVLPLPGYSVIYPENKIADSYKGTLNSDRLRAEDFRLRKLGLSLPGAYRKLVAFPTGIAWHWTGTESFSPSQSCKIVAGITGGAHVTQTSEHVPCPSEHVPCPSEHVPCPSDYVPCPSEHVPFPSGLEAPSTDQSDHVTLPLDNVPTESKTLDFIVPHKRIKLDADLAESTSRDLTLSFRLDPSCYATVCLREIMQG
ncbi:pseudouridylate synthase PUS7L isoform X2 [Nematostella vectensis]|nr:pseudouridylate synthase PUS7L isoform X2 [Nematostella vectensis]